MHEPGLDERILAGVFVIADQQAEALASCRAITIRIDETTQAHAIDELPRCADPDDQKFLELARDCAADMLITKDGDLLTLVTRKVRPLPFRIVAPRASIISMV